MVHWLSWNQFAYEKAEFHWILDNVETGILPMFDALEWGIDDAEWKRMCQLTSNTRNAAKARLEWKSFYDTFRCLTKS